MHSLHYSGESAVSDRSRTAVFCTYAADNTGTDNLCIFNIKVGYKTVVPAEQTDTIIISINRAVEFCVLYGISIAAELSCEICNIGIVFNNAYGRNFLARKVDIIAEDIILIPACFIVSDGDKFLRHGDEGVFLPVGGGGGAEVELCRFVAISLAYVFKAGVCMG